MTINQTSHQSEEGYGEDNRKAYLEFIAEFKNESDRAAVILGAAKLDYILFQILTKFLRPNVGSRDELLEGDSPLSTFSAQINICYRLGLIDSELARALHFIRKIRNAFAHEVAGGKLNSGSHRDRIRELAAPLASLDDYAQFKKVLFPEKTDAAGDFYSVLGIMVIRLERLFHDVIQIDNAQEIEFIPPGFLEKATTTSKRKKAKKSKSDA